MKKKLLILLIAFLIIIALINLNSFIYSLIHGIIQSLFGGVSHGKTFFVLAFISLNLTISLLAFNKIKKNKLAEKTLIALIVFIVIGFGLGAIHFLGFASEFGSLGPFGAISFEGEQKAIELSFLQHNHFPKTTLYFTETLLELNGLKKIDNGKPLFESLLNSKTFSLIYLSLFLIIGMLGIIFINLKLKEIKLIDYFLFLLALTGFLILLIDGGMFSAYFIIAFWFFAAFIERNYLKQKNPIAKTVFPLAVIAVYSFIFGYISFEGFIYASSWSIALFLTAGYLLIELIKSKEKIKFRLPSITITGAIFLFFLCSAGIVFLNNGFGELLVENNESGLYIYGLKENCVNELRAQISEFGEVKELRQFDWIGLAKIVPKKNFRLNELKTKLRENFSSKNYLIVEYFYPVQRNTKWKIQWLNEMPTEEKLKEMFNSEVLDLQISLERINRKEKTSIISVAGQSLPEQQIISLMTLIKTKSEKKFLIGRI